ncbi:MAG TPA: NAD-dependent epimerase/dehydratase family protein [Polyangiaceae bacterium]|nr:NAD-dependent epimerase/dehydratase family protein [Polyangiaceae bacterium]
MKPPPYVLVTGANGFLGATLVRKLLERGERVKAFVRPETNLSLLQSLPQDRLLLAVGDVMAEGSVYRALSGCRLVYHCAANFKLWDKNPKRVIDPAVIGTRHVLQATKARGIEKVVMTSSCAVLGTTQDEPMAETHQLNLSDPEVYTRAKVEAAEVVSEAVAAGQPVVSVLPSTLAGPGDRKPTPNGQMLLRYLSYPPGFRFPVTAGGLSIVDVEDVAMGHILAMEKGVVGESYILGGDNLTYTQIFEMLADITGLAEPSKPHGPGMAGLVGVLWELAARYRGGQPIMTRRIARDYVGSSVWVTSEKAETELGYTHRSAREALARSVRWFLDNGYVSEQAASRVRLELRPV